MHESDTDDDLKSNVFACPCCGKLLQINMRVATRRVRAITPDEAPSQAANAGQVAVDASELPAVTALKECGLWEAFEVAFKRIQVGEKPKFIASYAQMFMEHAGPIKKISPPVMRMLIQEFGYGKISVWGAQYLAAILVDGDVRAFVPMSLIKGETFYRLTESGGQLSQTTDNLTLPVWIKSRFGYVVGRGEQFQELQKRSIGAFANPSL